MTTLDSSLSLTQIAALLEATPTTLRAMTGALPDSALSRHPAPGEWCVKEIIGHIIEADRRGFDGRIRHILAEDDPQFQGWDQPQVAVARKDCGKDALALVEELVTMRSGSARLVKGLKAADLKRAGQHPLVGRLTIGDLLYEWIFHDHSHLIQLLEIIKAEMWPHMGNARGFSQT